MKKILWALTLSAALSACNPWTENCENNVNENDFTRAAGTPASMCEWISSKTNIRVNEAMLKMNSQLGQELTNSENAIEEINKILSDAKPVELSTENVDQIKQDIVEINQKIETILINQIEEDKKEEKEE